MPRPIWNGSISFGLVNVPIRLFSAVSHNDVRFNQLHDKDGGRIKQKRTCSIDGEEVEFANIVKGFEFEEGKYVRIEPSELDGLDPKGSRTIDIVEFVDLNEIDPMYFESAYYLAPVDTAEKPYALLTKSMQDSNKVAIGRFVMRTKEYLCALRAKDDVMILSTMLFADEIVDAGALEIPAANFHEVSDKEVAMAEQLIASLSAPFEPEKYTDRYREKVVELIEKKVAGEDIIEVPKEEPMAPVVDLMAALEASLQAAKEKRSAAS